MLIVLVGIVNYLPVGTKLHQVKTVRKTNYFFYVGYDVGNEK